MVNANGDDISGFGIARAKWGFPKIRGTFLGVPVLRIIVFWGLYIGVHLFWEITKGSPEAVRP